MLLYGFFEADPPPTSRLYYVIYYVLRPILCDVYNLNQLPILNCIRLFIITRLEWEVFFKQIFIWLCLLTHHCIWAADHFVGTSSEPDRQHSSCIWPVVPRQPNLCDSLLLTHLYDMCRVPISASYIWCVCVWCHWIITDVNHALKNNMWRGAGHLSFEGFALSMKVKRERNARSSTQMHVGIFVFVPCVLLHHAMALPTPSFRQQSAIVLSTPWLKCYLLSSTLHLQCALKVCARHVTNLLFSNSRQMLLNW